MHVLIAHKFYGRQGGPENVIYGAEKRLAQDGHRCVQFSMKSPYNETNPYYPFFVDNVDYGQAATGRLFAGRARAALNLIYSTKARRNLRALLNHEKVDIAHLHNIYHQISPSVLSLLKDEGIPVVLTLHDLKLICPNYRMYVRGKVCEACKKDRFYNAVLNKCVKDSGLASLVCCVEAYVHRILRLYEKTVSCFVCPSAFLKNKITEHGYPESKVRIVHNGIDAESVEPAWENSGYVLYFGRMDREKGIDTLAKAANRLRPLRIVLAGEGTERQRLMKDIAGTDNAYLDLKGFVAGKELEDIIKGAMFTVIPSELYENCSISVLESMAYGKPVIGSRIGGIPEQIIDGVNGLLFEPGNAEDLADKIAYLASRPELIVQMGREARRTVETKYSMDQHYEKLIALYQELIGGNKKG